MMSTVAVSKTSIVQDNEDQCGYMCAEVFFGSGRSADGTAVRFGSDAFVGGILSWLTRLARSRFRKDKTTGISPFRVISEPSGFSK